MDESDSKNGKESESMTKRASQRTVKGWIGFIKGRIIKYDGSTGGSMISVHSRRIDMEYVYPYPKDIRRCTITIHSKTPKAERKK